jgi:prepilin-type N-terminal cleavage/methylation domain-containing protein
MIKTRPGYTLIEVLIVVAILSVLVIATLMSIKNQRDKAEDARAKADLARLKIAFEDYYNDHNCYPPSQWFDDTADCGANVLTPYLNSIPCDRNTGLPYVLETDATTCGWYKLYATFSYPDTDEQAIAMRSSTGSTKGNYGVSSSNVVVSVYYDAGSGNNYYYCSGISNCTSYNPLIFSCLPSYTNNPNCDGGSNPCQVVGSCTPL